MEAFQIRTGMRLKPDAHSVSLNKPLIFHCVFISVLVESFYFLEARKLGVGNLKSTFIFRLEFLPRKKDTKKYSTNFSKYSLNTPLEMNRGYHTSNLWFKFSVWILLSLLNSGSHFGGESLLLLVRVSSTVLQIR